MENKANRQITIGVNEFVPTSDMMEPKNRDARKKRGPARPLAVS